MLWIVDIGCTYIHYLLINYIFSRRVAWKGLYIIIIIIIISLLMSPLLGHRPSLWITYKENGP
jgi:uncharacterized membrane protein YagU involved in acid resistance